MINKDEIKTLQLNTIIDINNEYEEYKKYTISKNKKVIDLKTYRILRKTILNELKVLIK